MAEENKGTVYQNLNRFLNLDPLNFDQASTGNIIPQQQKKIIIKGNSPEEIYRKGLELEQKKKIQDAFYRTTDRGFQKALQYEAGRIQAYMDYEGAEYYPIIASALDLFMEESTTIGMDGKMLGIYSNKERIRLELEDLFYNIINVNVNLPFWTRNTVKYGDNFCFLYGERGKGITAVRQLVNYEIERFERVQNGKMNVKFKERMTGDEFETFQMAHFRLLGDDKMIPYGSSVLNKVRRVFRMLVMAEDAMLTYRLLRAGDKRVYKIDVGNIDEDDIDEYIHKVLTRVKKMPQIDPNNGQIDYRFNIVGNDEDIVLPLRNANMLTGVETLQGASNLNQIQDIEYLRDQLFTGLGIAKPFLSFQDATGGGKNMAQFDIRFSKKVNRIQQAMIQELNKIAIIHLYYLGHTAEDLNNFTLTLSNPSTQQEQLKTDLFQAKAQAYTEVTRAEGGIAAMSHTNAKRKLWNWTDKEIVDDLRQQKIEKVIMQEFADSPVAIKKTGLFADIDKRYGESVNNVPTSGATGGAPAGPEMGGIGGGAPMGGGLPPIGGELGGGLPPIGGEPTGAPEGLPEPIAGLPNQSPSELPPIKESRSFDEYVNELVYGNTKESIIKKESDKLIIETDKKILEQNTKTANLITEMDDMLEKTLNIIKDDPIEINEEETDANEEEIDVNSIQESLIIDDEK